jgi:copper oxidase (laccase) domain-containing protein
VNTTFELVKHNGVELLVYAPWWSKGIVHGMTTRALPFGTSSLGGSVNDLCLAVGATKLAMPLQCHGADLVNLSSRDYLTEALQRDGDLLRRISGDALLAPISQVLESDIMAYGVMTADCVPVIVAGDGGYLLVHAGWRGLANGIISKTTSEMSGPKEALVFACAGAHAYEVGEDVIESLKGRDAVYSEVAGSPGKYLLDIGATAARQLSRAVPSLEISISEVCTIRDTRFHSYRRDGAKAGRNVTFIVP